MHRYVLVALLVAGSASALGDFQRHDIAEFRAGYQIAVTDMNGDGRPDIVGVSTDTGEVVWFENPDWKRHDILTVNRAIDVAPLDLDHDGRPELAVASGFYYADSSRGGEIQWLDEPATPGGPWRVHPIAVDPVTHRIAWGDLDGDGWQELVHAPIFGPGSRANVDTKPVHLWAFRPPQDLRSGQWDTWKIDESLTVLHGLYVGDLDGDGRDEILTASFEGIFWFDWGGGGVARWNRVRVGVGAKPKDEKPETARGSSEVAPGKLASGVRFLAAIEPWHGDQVVVYTPDILPLGEWQRRVLDETIREGHCVVVADFDGDHNDEIVAGWRGGDGGLALYRFSGEADIAAWKKTELARGIKVEDAVAADMNGDGRLDLVVLASRSNLLLWLENTGN